MTFPHVTPADWRAQVEKELAGAPFEKALVHRTSDGLSILPLYTALPETGALEVDCGGAPFRICMRHDTGEALDALREDLEGGADAVWLRSSRSGEDAVDDPLSRIDPTRTFAVIDIEGTSPVAILQKLALHAGAGSRSPVALATDPCGLLAQGRISARDLPGRYSALLESAQLAEKTLPSATTAMASSLPYNDAGADGADEIAFALATGVTYLRVLLQGGLTPEAAARHIALQVSVGRDTFVEVCKLRALRLCWQKVLRASGAGATSHALVHAVCSSRTLTQRDPWVNMLRVTTQVFAAVLGGADLVTPAAFDQALGPPSALGRRVARNTGLVLREESHLGRVCDPAGGSYYFETLTHTLSHEAWKRFQSLEREGGIEAGLASGRVQTQLASGWRTQLEQIAKRRTAILGVSEFANLGEKLPVSPPAIPDGGRQPDDAALPVHRDAEAFERLRLRSESARSSPEALLVPLGPLAESRARVGFATGFFGAGGIRTSETPGDRPATIACLCGSDDRYAAEAIDHVRALKALGTRRVLLAGRPGALEAPLRKAGIDGFLFVGCDVAATLAELHEVFDEPA